MKVKLLPLLLLFSLLASGDAVLQLTLEKSSEEIQLTNYEVVDGVASESSGAGEYFIVIELSSETGEAVVSGKFELSEGVNFLLLPYRSDFKFLRLHGEHDELILEKALETCNLDAECNGRENYLSCPSDCPTGSSDGYCDGVIDLVCDLDCGPEFDNDCVCNRDNACDEGENSSNCAVDCGEESVEVIQGTPASLDFSQETPSIEEDTFTEDLLILLGLVLGLALILIGAVYAYKRRGALLSFTPPKRKKGDDGLVYRDGRWESA